MKITPVKGTNDYLPEEVALRDRLQDIILKAYRSAGFTRISTPILEELENLDNSDGGETSADIQDNEALRHHLRGGGSQKCRRTF